MQLQQIQPTEFRTQFTTTILKKTKLNNQNTHRQRYRYYNDDFTVCKEEVGPFEICMIGTKIKTITTLILQRNLFSDSMTI